MRKKVSFVAILILCQAWSSYGDPCTTIPTGETGECTPLLECQTLIEEYKRDRTHQPTICNKDLRTVCCPTKYMTTVQPTTTTNKAVVRIKHDQVLGPDGPDYDSEPFIACQVIKKCAEFKSHQVMNETVNSFVFGEPPKLKEVPFCNQNLNNIGIATFKEFPHIAVIKVLNRTAPRNSVDTTRGIGSLISERHVITSVFCLFTDIDLKVTVELGVFNFNDIGLRESFNVDELDQKYGVTILKLDRKVVFTELVMPICLFPEEDFSSEALLAGWTGDWRECDPKLKKWHIENRSVVKGGWQFKIDETTVINYRQVLLPGSPLQIYHPSSTCQYSLIGIFEQLDHGHYTFSNLHKKLRWIENIVWPKRLLKMSERAYQVLKKGLKI